MTRDVPRNRTLTELNCAITKWSIPGLRLGWAWSTWRYQENTKLKKKLKSTKLKTPVNTDKNQPKWRTNHFFLSLFRIAIKEVRSEKCTADWWFFKSTKRTAISYLLHLFPKNAGSAAKVKGSCQRLTGGRPRKPERWLTKCCKGYCAWFQKSIRWICV